MTDQPAAPPIYQPINNQQRLYERVVQQIVQQIVSGVLLPGMTLPVEPMLAQQFGVSRTVIREAIRVVVSKGLLSVKHGSGMRIQDSRHWNHLDPLVLFEQVRAGHDTGLLDELIELRRLFEPEAAALAAARRAEDHLAGLRAAFSQMRAVVHDPAAYTRFDIAFHELILVAARNRLLREALRPVAEVLQAGRLLSIRQPDAPEKSLRGHAEILHAIEHQDADTARAAMRSHILQFEQDIHRATADREWPDLGA